MNKLTEEQRAYLAGFFDGEGTVYFKEALPQYRTRVILRATQKTPEVLQMLHEWTGVGHLYLITPRGANRNPRWDWVIGSIAEVRYFIRQVWPYAVVKRKKLKEGYRHTKR